MPTLTAYENRVVGYCADHALPHGKRAAKTIARMLYERQARMTDLDLERFFNHADPTPAEALAAVIRSR